MAARTFEELDAWLLATELKRRVYEILTGSSAARDADFCNQLRSAAGSAPANISEGFGYYNHPQFARHVRIAIGSLDETRNYLRDGIERRFWTDQDLQTLLRLCKRARGACVGLLEHLTTTDAPQPWHGTRLRPKKKVDC
jgi:four helix bundle protein